MRLGVSIVHRPRWGAGTMKRIVMLGLIAFVSIGSTGCLLNQYSSDPNVRMSQLLNQSANLRQIEYEKRRIWLNDHPSNLTPDRINGAIQ